VSVIDVYPRCAETALEAGWEIIGHAIVQRSLQLEENETEIIRQTAARLRKFTGKRTRGWLGPGFGETVETPEHLSDAGFDHVYDWMVDDLPCWMKTSRGAMIAMPYALELNDVTIFLLGKNTGGEYYEYFRDTVEMLEPELKTHARVLTLGLHPHIIGVPHRLKYLARTLDMLARRRDTIFMTGSQIADWFIKHSKPDAGKAARGAKRRR
jgi:hypothetical protein